MRFLMIVVSFLMLMLVIGCDADINFKTPRYKSRSIYGRKPPRVYRTTSRVQPRQRRRKHRPPNVIISRHPRHMPNRNAFRVRKGKYPHVFYTD